MMFTLIILFLIARALLRPRWFYRPWGMYRGFGTWDRPFVGGPGMGFGPRGPGMGRYGRW